MVGIFGLWKMLTTVLSLLVDFSPSLPSLHSHPPLYFSWFSHCVGKPVPGFVSTLFHHMYSVPLRSVQMFLQAIEQVWQPMHLSRWNTIEICERTSMSLLHEGQALLPVLGRGAGMSACPPLSYQFNS